MHRSHRFPHLSEGWWEAHQHKMLPYEICVNRGFSEFKSFEKGFWYISDDQHDQTPHWQDINNIFSVFHGSENSETKIAWFGCNRFWELQSFSHLRIDEPRLDRNDVHPRGYHSVPDA